MQHGHVPVAGQRADPRAQLGLEILHDLRIGRERIAGPRRPRRWYSSIGQ